MVTVSSIILAVTLVGLFFGALMGLIRGRDRALLRLILVIVSAVLALSLRGSIVDAVMNFNVDGQPLQEMLIESFSDGSESIPAGLQNLIFALIEILIGFVSYFILLFSLRFLTWFFLFPFLKLIIRSIEKKRAIRIWNEQKNVEAAPSENVDDFVSKDLAPTTEVYDMPTRKERKKIIKKNKHRGMGALIGLLQGVLLAYLLFAPLTCLATQAEKIVSVEMDGKPLVEIPEEIGLSEYTQSALGKIYNATGTPLYRLMTSTKDADGKEVSLEKLLDSAVSILDIADKAMTVEKDLNVLNDKNATPEEIIGAVNSLGDKIISIGNSLEQIDEGTKDMIVDLATELIGEDAPAEEIDKFVEILTPEILVQAGHGIKSYATYEQVKLDGEEFTAEQAAEIVSGVNDCLAVIDSISDVVGEEIDVNDISLDIEENDKMTFKAAIDGMQDMSAEDKDSLYAIFGIEN